LAKVNSLNKEYSFVGKEERKINNHIQYSWLYIKLDFLPRNRDDTNEGVSSMHTLMTQGKIKMESEHKARQ